MAVPVIGLVSPNVGPTMGTTMVEVRGSGFRLPTPQAATGPGVPRPVPVEVLVGSAKSKRVLVVSSQRLFFVTPPGNEGAASLTVRNIDDDGVVIPGETTTRAGFFAYQRVPLTVRTDQSRIVRELIAQMRRGTIAEVVLSPHTEWDSDGDTMRVLDIAKLPAIALIGPRMPENRFYSTNAALQIAVGNGEFVQRAPTKTVDMVFTVRGMSDTTEELMSLVSLVEEFFKATRKLEMPTVDGGSTLVSWELEVTDPFDVERVVGSSNLHAFAGEVTIRGVEHEYVAGFAPETTGVVGRGTRVEDDVEIDVEQTGTSYLTGPSPGE